MQLYLLMKREERHSCNFFEVLSLLAKKLIQKFVLLSRRKRNYHCETSKHEQLKGISVDGRPFVFNDENTKSLCLRKQSLQSTFEVVPKNIFENQLAHYIRGYLLHIIGTKILPN